MNLFLFNSLLSAIPIGLARQIMLRLRLNRSQLIKLKVVACVSATLMLGIVHTEVFNQDELPTPMTPHRLAIIVSPAINFAIQTLNFQSPEYSLAGGNDSYNLLMSIVTGILMFYYNMTTKLTIFENNGPLQFIGMINCVNVWGDLFFFSMATKMRVIENGVVTLEYVWNGSDWVARQPRRKENGSHRERIMARRQRRRS